MNTPSEQIFISYRWSDKANNDTFAAIVRAIEAITGLTAFWDVESLRSGTFADELRRKVASAYVFMPVVTRGYLAFGAAGNRENDKDYCLMEYETAVRNGVKIVPLFLCAEGDKHTVDTEAVKAAARRTAEGQYDEADIAILQKHLLLQNGIQLSSLSEDGIRAVADRLGMLIFDQFCTSDKVPYYKKVLAEQEARLNPVRILGDFDDAGLTLDNSYIPLTLQRHYTQAEQKQREQNHESTAPVDQPEAQLLSALTADRYAVVVGDAGQGKSSYVRRLAIDLGRKAQAYGLSKTDYFPLYLECKYIDPQTLAKADDFLCELSHDAALSRPALDAILRYGKPLFILDAMDEVAPEQMDRLVSAVHTHLTAKHPNVYCLFTTRPGQKLVASGDMTLDHTEATVVRRYTVKALDEAQRDAFVGRLAAAKGIDTRLKDEFIAKLIAKERALADYTAVSRNPFVLLTVCADYAEGEDLPADRFDAILRVIDNTIARDLGKERYNNIKSKDVKVILGAVSYRLYRQRDEGQTPRAKAQMPVELAESLFGLDESDRDDRALLDNYRHFFERSKLFDSNGFRHEFLAATYAAYYLFYIMERRAKKDKDPLDVGEISALSHDTDYWRSVTEALLCLLDRESDDSKTYLEPILGKMQEGVTPDYDTLYGAVSQFTRHQARGAQALLAGMLRRGCEGILSGEETDEGFICAKGVNPYEELFYYPAIYPALQPYLPNLPTQAGTDEQAYLHNELRQEVCALFGNNAQEELSNLYAARSGSTIDRQLQCAAYRSYKVRGFVRIPYSVTSIGIEAFAGCSGLTSIIIPAGVTAIGDGAFAGCSGLTSVTIPTGVPSIGDYAFYGCSGLTSIIIPDSVTSIGNYAFEGCNGLTSITIPNSVTSIGEDAFQDCSALTSIAVNAGNPKYHSVGNCLIETETKTLVLGCKISVIPADGSVTSIGNSAFAGCSGLTSITIPKGVTSIGHLAFYGCSGLTSITIPKGVTSIGWGAFGCSGLTSITLPDNVTSIESEAFYDCSGLTSITLPVGVTTIKHAAFARCNGLTSIAVNAGNPRFHSAGNCLIETKTRTLVLGCKTSVIPADGSVTYIGHLAFYDCSELTSITIPVGVTSIEDAAFAGCSGLTSITIPVGVTSIGGGAFAGCSGLTSITIPAGVTSIGNSAFAGCNGLASITIPAGVTSIGEEAFYDCSGLTSITIPDSVTSIGARAFQGCSWLTTINYQGTKAQWNTIRISMDWNDGTDNYTIHCTDGDIAKKGYLPF